MNGRPLVKSLISAKDFLCIKVVLNTTFCSIKDVTPPYKQKHSGRTNLNVVNIHVQIHNLFVLFSA